MLLGLGRMHSVAYEQLSYPNALYASYDLLL